MLNLYIKLVKAKSAALFINTYNSITPNPVHYEK